LEFWRSALSPEFTQKQALEVRNTLNLMTGDRVVDVPCGNGRLTLELAAAGLRMTGLDLASEFIEEAKEAARKRNLSLELVCRDMRDLPASGGFDAAYCVGNSFGYLDHEGNADFLKAVARTLRPKGRFLLEYPLVAEIALARKPMRQWHKAGAVLMISEQSYDVTRSRLQTNYVFIQNGTEHTCQAAYQIYTCRETMSMMQDAGFTELRLLKDLSGSPSSHFTLGAEVLYVMAERAE
jgi:SAM-dependent methyltransferase